MENVQDAATVALAISNVNIPCRRAYRDPRSTYRGPGSSKTKLVSWKTSFLACSLEQMKRQRQSLPNSGLASRLKTSCVVLDSLSKDHQAMHCQTKQKTVSPHSLRATHPAVYPLAPYVRKSFFPRFSIVLVGGLSRSGLITLPNLQMPTLKRTCRSLPRQWNRVEDLLRLTSRQAAAPVVYRLRHRHQRSWLRCRDGLDSLPLSTRHVLKTIS